MLRVLVCILLFSACSSAPKNPGDIVDQRKRAESQLEQGNKQADRGSLEAALVFLDEALRLAVATDDPGLRIRAGLSRSNVLFSMGRHDEAEAGWNKALDEAARLGDKELLAVSRIHISRGKLLSSSGSSAGRSGIAQSVRDDIEREMAQIKSEQLYSALAWTVIALAEKELGRFAAAETAVRRSMAVHEKANNLELVAYNWFLIASFRSLSGDYGKARQALEEAISFDRRVENSWGLANDWRALGEVQKKAGDRESSRAAFIRSAEIFRSIGLDAAASETLSRIE